ncbi:hypothetical protein ACQ86G_14175 [Roseateles chitinivorans]|uniref:hypothetical protein n=1 Tax=Roseateles chitinivorans TaxID=2917965 RepID=UPI003D6785D4
MKEILKDRKKYLSILDDSRTPMAIGCMSLGLFVFRSLDQWNAIYVYVLLGCAVGFNAADVKLGAKEERLYYEAREDQTDLRRTRMLSMICNLASQASQLLCLAYVFAFFFRNV